MVYTQFQNSPNIQKLNNLFNVLDNTGDIDKFINQYVNFDTAFGKGLDEIGNKIGIRRNLLIAITESPLVFGFSGQNLGNFNNSNFAPLNEQILVQLNDSDYRYILKLCYLKIAIPLNMQGFLYYWKFIDPNCIIKEETMKITITFDKQFNEVIQKFLQDRRNIVVPAAINLILEF